MNIIRTLRAKVFVRQFIKDCEALLAHAAQDEEDRFFALFPPVGQAR